LSPAVMVNILGDAWGLSSAAGGRVASPQWERLLGESGVHLHLYGKSEPKHGRKMGHFTVTASSADLALSIAERLKAMLPSARL